MKYVLKDAVKSVISNIKEHFDDVLSSLKSEKESKSGYLLDAERCAEPGISDQEVDTIRSVGMSSCKNPLILSMQAQAFISWDSFIEVGNLGNSFGSGKVKDLSYTLQDIDNGHKLKIKALVSSRYLQDIYNFSGNAHDADNKVVDVILDKTRNFKEAVITYTDVEVDFTMCSKQEFDAFIKENPDLNIDSLKNYEIQDGSEYMPKIYYIPTVVSADYKLCMSSSLKKVDIIVAQDDISLKNAGIKLIDNALDVRLDFIAGSLQDALSVEGLDEATKQKHIKYALINLAEIVDSNNFKNQDFASNKYFTKIVSMLTLAEISIKDQIIISNLYSESAKSKSKIFQSYERAVLGSGAMVSGAIVGVGLAIGLATPLNVAILAAGVFLMFAVAASYYNGKKQQHNSLVKQINADVKSLGSDSLQQINVVEQGISSNHDKDVVKTENVSLDQISDKAGNRGANSGAEEGKKEAGKGRTSIDTFSV